MDNFEQRFLDARRHVIEQDYASLNDMQRKAVMATEGPLLILAGAGSGKTTVLINRIENIMRYGKASDRSCQYVPATATEADIETMQQGGDEARAIAACDPVPPWRIIAITFTNKAANELKERLSKRLGPSANDIWAATFHSACVRILRRDADLLGFPNNFTIYDSSDSQSVVKQILKERNMDEKTYNPKSILADLSNAKDQYVSPLEHAANLEKSGDIRKRSLAPVIVEYARRLYNAGAMDFDDLIFYTVKLLTEQDEVREYWQNKFRYVLIDEYQDTNKIQYMLAKLLSGKWGNICVVGDDDQSIYKFRGATIENILSFEEEFKGCRTIRLEQNYRSTEHILEAANAVIANNTNRKGKNLWTNSGAGNKLLLYATQNQDEEARFVAGKILEAYGQGANFRDHAVLYRMNAQSNQLEYAFKRNGIPYKVYGGMRFFDRAEVKDMLAYLCVINAPDDDLRLRRIINTPVRGIGLRTIEQLGQIAAQENTSMYDVIRRCNQYPEFKRSAPNLMKFFDMMEELRAVAENAEPDVLYDLVLEKTGYIESLEKKGTDENNTRIENIKELKTSIISFMENSGDRTLSGFLDDVALYTDLDNADENQDCVTMMTMHSAKGLEFPTVFIVGMEENMFPSSRCIGDPVEMEEERRLCYVALTRAKKMLYLLCARQRMLFGKTTSNLPSRFTEEIPAEHMDKGGFLPSKNKPLFNDEFGTTEQPMYGNAHYGSGYSRSGSGSGYSAGYGSSYGSSSRKSSPIKPKKPAAPAGGGLPSFNVGDKVSHKAFGPGEIVKKTPMGGDALVEIEFEKVGTKRLMLKVAAANMTKV